jgi:PAS domain S-box-containing protein
VVTPGADPDVVDSVQPPPVFRRSRSVRHNLTALFLTIIGLLAVAFAWVAYEQVERALRASGTERIRAAASQVADLLSQSASARTAETRRLAMDPQVRRAVLSSGSSPAPPAIQDFLSRNDQVAIWGYEPSRGAVLLGAGSEALQGEGPPPRGGEGVSELKVADGRVWYYTTVALNAAGHGAASEASVTVLRSIRQSQANELIERLIGPGAVLRFGNRSGDVWTDMSRPASAPPEHEVSVGSNYTDEAGVGWIGVAVPVADTPWLFWVAEPEQTILAPAALLLRSLLPIALLLMAIGVGAVYVLSGRITQPLETLAAAAEGIARGDYTRRVTVRRDDEVGRLATIFNAMADRIARSRDLLEGRVAERTRQLEEANAALSNREAELRNTTTFLDSIIDNLPAVLFVKDVKERRYMRLNRAGEEVLGMPAAEVIGRTDHDLFPSDLASALSQGDAKVLDQHATVSLADETVPTRSGGERNLQITKVPVRNATGQAEYLLGIAVDLTGRRQAEEEARAARIEAERASRAKSQFLSRMSHDLRTPLNAMLGFAQLLDMDPSLSQDHAESVRHILKGGSHLLKLVNEVLDIARIESGGLSLSLEPVRVSEVVEEVVQLMRPLAESRKIAITAVLENPDLHMLADNQRLKQVLLNLVGNAIKYNRDHGRVELSVRRDGTRVRVEVHDTGRGIAADKRWLLFRPFERLGAEQGNIEGTGLGLAVAKGLIEAMNGRIGVDTPAEGATFWITLPEAQTAASHAADDAMPPAQADAPRGGTVLYIEDNPSNIRLIERLLTRRPGIRLLIARDGGEGLRVAAEHAPDLILLDLHLPDMSGRDVLASLVADDRTSAIPVVIVSADATTAQSERLLQFGARAYLTKPILLSAFLEMVDRHLAEGRRPESLAR